MGSMTYDNTTIYFEDRVMAHLQIVIVQKFRKMESFLMSWKCGQSVSDSRGSVWLSPSIPLTFKFLGSRSPAIDREWLLLLEESADSSTGLVVTMPDGRLVESTPMNGEHSNHFESDTHHAAHA